MENKLVTFILEAVFTGVYFICLFLAIRAVFDRLPINFALDLLAIACMVIAFVVSVGLAEFTVRKIKEHL